MCLPLAFGLSALIVVISGAHVAGSALTGHQGAAFARSLRATLMASPAE